ncbi:MAG: putative toxin-antitoxin system toxin component, PIN family [Planctomycetaceae bacterium]
MRVVLDANVVIAAVASRGLCEAVVELCLERHQAVTCKGLLAEVSRKLVGKLRLPRAMAEEYVGFLRGNAEVVEPVPVKAGTCRDPADEMVLGLIEPGRVDVIVTGDKDLLVVRRFGAAHIVTPRRFWEWAAEDRSPGSPISKGT